MRRINLKTAQAARPKTIRDINRRIVLNYVREREPISRAEIARHTELQRSTVSAIIDELQIDGLIEEIGAGVSTGGRRPTLLRLRMAGAAAIGVSIELSHTVIATSDLAGRVLEQRKFATDPCADVTLKRVIEIVREMKRRSNHAIKSVGVTLPGLVDPAAGRAINVPYFKWRDWAIKQELAAATGLEVTIENDANAVALAELWFGRPEVSNARDFIVVLVAAGVGCGMVFDGQIYRGQRGAAGEFGHMVVGADAPVACSCGNRDCWEAFSSERAALARHQKLARRGNHAADFNELIARALGGERHAHDALTETAHYLGLGISNLIVGFSPQSVIVCGAITGTWSLIGEALGETIEKSVRRGLPSVPVTASTLGKQPTLMGALSLVLAGKFASAHAA